jgi:drug/metabolite transporter (DMT)-like permease
MDEQPAPPPAASTPALVAGFAAIYLIWGSTFLGIKYAVQTLPPLLMAGARFVLPGAILYAILRLRGAPRPSCRQWGAALLTGALLLLGGNGLVTIGQRTIPSGHAALIIATTPVWMLVLAWLFYGGARPGWRVVLGMAAGFAGAALLIGDPTSVAAGSRGGALCVLASPVLWSLGSLQGRVTRPADSALLASAMQMLAGGALMLLAGTGLGEWGELATRQISTRSIVAFLYLSFCGALVGFSTYAWLLRVASPAAVSTYAYVNPLVAVLLGWLVGGEALGGRIGAAAALILGAVVLITLPRQATPLRGVAKQAEPSSESQSDSSLRPVSGASQTTTMPTANTRLVTRPMRA